MSDIVNRLRHIGVTLADLKSLWSKHYLAEISADAYKAADEITRLRAQVERLNKNDLLAQDAIHEADKRAEAAEARVAVLAEEVVERAREAVDAVAEFVADPANAKHFARQILEHALSGHRIVKDTVEEERRYRPPEPPEE